MAIIFNCIHMVGIHVSKKHVLSIVYNRIKILMLLTTLMCSSSLNGQNIEGDPSVTVDRIERLGLENIDKYLAGNLVRSH